MDGLDAGQRGLTSGRTAGKSRVLLAGVQLGIHAASAAALADPGGRKIHETLKNAAEIVLSRF